MMKNNILIASLALALAAGLVAPAAAQPQAIALAGDVKVVRQVTENGQTRETLAEPTQVLPGDRLVFTTRYSNASGQPVEDFVVTNPLPAPVRLAQSGEFSVSVDGGKSFGPLAAARVTGADGKPRAAEPGDVTHVQWRLARIAPGASGEVRYFAEVR